MTLLIAPEAAIKPEQVAPKVGEVAELPVPVAPTTSKKKNPPKAGEADHFARSLRAQPQQKIVLISGSR